MGKVLLAAEFRTSCPCTGNPIEDSVGVILEGGYEGMGDLR